jgi:nucleoside-diphosphate-sugar epimerase
MSQVDRILIIGANGFIGHHLSKRLVTDSNFRVTAIDLKSDRLRDILGHDNFEFKQGDILDNDGWISREVEQSDVVIPLVAIASPLMYIKQPLKVFELDFEANLPIVRECVSQNKHLIFPSTSEVYGMSSDLEFDPLTTNLVTGPIQMQRWIYSTCKQLMDRIIYAYGESENLNYTLFRPFNWFGPGLDSIDTPREGGSRVVTNFIGSILRGEEIKLVNGGSQRRAFTYIDDGIDALVQIIEKRHKSANRQIFNIGNPVNDYSISHLAHLILELSLEHPLLKDRASKVNIVSEDQSIFYGAGYQDVMSRNPKILNTSDLLNWQPKVQLRDGLKLTLDHYAQGEGL